MLLNIETLGSTLLMSNVLLQGGGVAAVLTRPPGQGEEWLKQGDGNDLFIDFGKVCGSVAMRCVWRPSAGSAAQVSSFKTP